MLRQSEIGPSDNVLTRFRLGDLDAFQQGLVGHHGIQQGVVDDLRHGFDGINFHVVLSSGFI